MPLTPYNPRTLARATLGGVEVRPEPGAFIPRKGKHRPHWFRRRPPPGPWQRLGASVLGAFGFDTSWIEPAVQAASAITTTAVSAAQAGKAAKVARAEAAAQAKVDAQEAKAARRAKPAPPPAPARPAWLFPVALAGGAVALALVLSRRPSAPPVYAAPPRPNPHRRRAGKNR